MVEPPNAERGISSMRPGDMYYAPWQLEPAYREGLSARYFTEHSETRAPVVVILPDGTPFCVDQRAWNNGGYFGDGWTVTGDVPVITVSPSINVVGSYHGYIIEGEITDDIDGRAEAHRQRWAKLDYYAGE